MRVKLLFLILFVLALTTLTALAGLTSLTGLAAHGSQRQAASTSHSSHVSSSQSSSSSSLCTSNTAIPLSSLKTNGASTTSSTGLNSPSRMKMGPHMKMTASRTPTQADIQRAQTILHITSVCLAKYKDYLLALRDGYEIFAPDVPQDIYHFANLQNYMAAQTRFDPLRPTALLYKKAAYGYQLVGVMFSAPTDLTEDQLNQLFPLGVAPWHLHVNVCLPRGDTDRALFPSGSKFGLDGTITTEAACAKASGTFLPQMFGWMVHISPFGQGQV